MLRKGDTKPLFTQLYSNYILIGFQKDVLIDSFGIDEFPVIVTRFGICYRKHRCRWGLHSQWLGLNLGDRRLVTRGKTLRSIDELVSLMFMESLSENNRPFKNINRIQNIKNQ